MAVDTLIMVVLICVGCALLIAGLVALAISAFGTIKAARKVGINSKADVQEVVQRIRALESKVREMREKQAVVAERLSSLSATLNNLRYLKDEIDRATGYLSKLKF
jgi:predicted  nucleic acid-binding Zn-ribbon protein